MTSLKYLVELFYSLRYTILFLAIAAYAWLGWVSYRRLHQFRGPTLAHYSNIWMSNAIGTRRAHLELFHVSEAYGDLARIAPNILLTCDPEVVIRMNSARSRYTKSKWYAGQKVEVDHDNLFSTLDEILHTKKRAQMAIGYAGKEIDGLEAMIDKHLLQFIALINDKYITFESAVKPLDLARKASFFTMDVITEVAFNRTWGCLVADDDVNKWFESMELIMPSAIRASTIPWLASLFGIPLLGKMVMPSDKDPTGAGKLLSIAKEIVRRRFEEEDPGEKRDMMGSFIRHGVSQRECVSEATLQIVAGVDTTATAIRATMLFIITNIHVYKKLQAEINSFAPQDSIIADDEARMLPFLQAVIKEGARMWPPATGLMSKVVPPEGDTINGRFVPGGTQIGKCEWAIQRSKKVYGEDSSIFRPERWLEAKGEKLERMERTFGLLWGYGKYYCLGKNIAFMELNKVFFELLRNFEFTLMDPSHPWVSNNYGLWMQKEMYVIVTHRRK